MLADIAWSQGIEEAWTSIATFVPRFLAFVVVLVVGFAVAKLLAKLADAVLERVGFDRAVDRGGVRRALARTSYDPSDIIAKVVFWGVALVVLQLAFGIFGPNPVSEMLSGIVGYLPNVVAAIVIVVVAAAIAAAVREIVEASVGGLSYGRMLANLAGGAVMAVGAFAALDQLRIAPAVTMGLFYAALAVVAGSAIVAIGGGGIQPMRERWERALTRYDEERPAVRDELKGAPERIRERADARLAQIAPPSEQQGPPAAGGPVGAAQPPPPHWEGVGAGGPQAAAAAHQASWQQDTVAQQAGWQPPAPSQPEWSQPPVGQQASAPPAAGQPGWDAPAAGQQASAPPAAGQPAWEAPAAGQPVAGQPDADETANMDTTAEIDLREDGGAAAGPEGGRRQRRPRAGSSSPRRRT